MRRAAGGGGTREVGSRGLGSQHVAKWPPHHCGVVGRRGAGQSCWAERPRPSLVLPVGSVLGALWQMWAWLWRLLGVESPGFPK